MKGDRPLGKHSFWLMMRLTGLGSFFIEGDGAMCPTKPWIDYHSSPKRGENPR
jgi:hypothetical protein